ncbi:MAG: ABC transporter ATP-binding protein [Acidobacteria bacterium]|nr:ABC transporter ATP-binding protein [Acidobacteriota bacterium]
MSATDQNSPKIFLDNVTVVYASGSEQILAVENVTFSVGDKEFLSIIGPSGCGKSTILHVIAGFIQPTSGEVKVSGSLVRQPDQDRGVVFQKYNLFPWKKVRQNIEFGLRMKGVPKEERGEVVADYLKLMGLTEFADSYPHSLSVGMQQRVGLARAYANDPDVLLMDEPFSSLDSQTGERMRELLLRVWSQNLKTVVFITHDIEEAIQLSDRVLLLSPRPGRVHEEFQVNLPRPRSREIFADSRFVELRKRIMAAMFTHTSSE